MPWRMPWAGRARCCVYGRGGERARLGILLALLGSNGVTAESAEALLSEGLIMAEGYDWLRRLVTEHRVLSMEDITQPRHGMDAMKGKAGGFAWLSHFAAMPASRLRQYIFLPFPRGPSLPGGACPRPASGAAPESEGSRAAGGIPQRRRVHPRLRQVLGTTAAYGEENNEIGRSASNPRCPAPG